MKKIMKLVSLLVLALLFVCSVAFVACTPEEQSETATYSVTVSKAEGVDVDLTAITAQWKSGTEVKGSKALDADGKASVELEKGNYTVTLMGSALENLKWTDASVTSSNLSATITLTKKEPAGPTTINYTVTVTCNDSELNLSTLAVQWVASEGEPTSSLVGADGKSSKELEPGDYTVSIIGFTKPSYYTVTTDTVSATKTNAEITITAIKRDVAVTVESPVDLPNDVKIQVKDGSENYGDAVAISEGKATVVVPFGKAVTLELVGISSYDYLTSNSVSVAATDKTATITVTLAQVTYTINVTAPSGVDVDGLTVTLLDSNSDPVTGATELAIEEGVATVTLLAGEYTVVLNGLNTTDYRYEADALTITKHTATVTISAKYWTISPEDDAPTVIGTFEDENEVKRIKLNGVEHSKSYSVMLSSDLDGEESDFNLHDFTIVYGGETFTVGKTRLEQELDSFIVIYIVDGQFELTVQADGAFAEEVSISIEEYEEIDTTIELDVEKNIYATTTYNFTAPSNDAYLITIDVNGLSSKDYQISMGEGPVFGDGSNRSTATTYEFFASANELIEISVYLYASGTINLVINKTYGEFKLGEETTITVPAGFNSGVAKPVLKAPYKGIYKLKLLGDVNHSNFFVSLEGKEPLNLDETTHEVQFLAEVGNVAIHFINNTSTGSFDIRAVVTLVKDTGNILPVGGQNTANIGGVDAPAKLVLEGAEAGKTYRLLVGWTPSFPKTNQITLKYCEKEYDIRLVNDSESKYNNYYTVDFEYVADENNIEIYIPLGGVVKAVVVKLEKVKEAATTGPEVGDSILMTPGNDQDSAVELDFGATFIDGGTYTIRITKNPSDGDPEAFLVYNYYVVYGNGSSDKVFFTRGEENFVPYMEATFTATSAPVKLYAEGARGPATPIAVTVTIIAAPAAPGAGSEVGDSETVTPGKDKNGAVELPFEFVAGKKYTLKLTGSQDDGFFMFVYTIVYSNGETQEAVSGDGCFEVTITADGNPVKIFAVHMRSADPIPVTFEITAIA